MVVAIVVLWVAVVTLGFVLLGLVRRVSEALEVVRQQLELLNGHTPVPEDFGGLSVGSFVSGLATSDLPGSSGADVLLKGRILVVFMESDCEPCEDFARQLGGLGDTVGGVPVVMIVDGETQDRGWLPQGVWTLPQWNRRVSRAFKNIASPQAFALEEGRVIGKSIPSSIGDLERLAQEFEGGREHGSHASLGGEDLSKNA